MSLWIFGDSFSSDDIKEDNYAPWYNIIATSLKTDINNCSVLGASMHYIIRKWNFLNKQIKEDDVVIVLLTSARKTYFFENYPSLSMPWMINKKNYNTGWEMLTSQQQLAFTQYYECLHNDLDIELLIKSFLYWVDKISNKLKHKIIVINCFNDFEINVNEYSNLIVSTGLSLIEISQREVDNDMWDKLLINDNCYDTRKNHLTNVNHNILSSCILESLTTNKLELNELKFNLVR